MKRSAWGMMLALLLITAAAAWAEPYVPILLGDTQFDPKCAEPVEVRQARSALAAATSAAAAGATSAYSSTIAPGRFYYVVQFQGPVRSDWKRQVRALGGVFVAYVPRYAFAVRMTSTEAAQVGALPCVRWVGPFPPQWKYRKSLVADKTRGVTLLVSLFPGELLDRVCTYIKDRRLWYLGFSWTPNPAIRMHAPASAVTDLAALPEVLWIQEYELPKPTNSMGQRFLNISNVTGLPWGVDTWNDYGLFGAGQIVGIADTGLDTGNLDTLHPDFLDANGNPRVVATFPLATGDFWGDFGGHGTHVTGSVLGNGSMSGSNPAASAYTGSFAGMAPEARVVFQSVAPGGGGFVGLPLDLGDLFDQSFKAGARIHTNSWGSSIYPGEYIYESFMVDNYLWRHPEMTILFAAGNDGVDTNWHGIIDPVSLGQPATAKDCITVGATESFRPPFAGWKGLANLTWGEFIPSRWPADPIATDYTSDNPDGMAAFSSRGPCADGRIKPDVCAPGVNIISTWSQLAGAAFEDVYDPWYLYMSGTSMATPLTAGAATVVRQYYVRDRGAGAPTGSLIKATLIHGARDLAPGQYGAGLFQEIQPRPDRSQGWGRPSIGATLHPERPYPGATLIFHDYGLIKETGASDVHPIVVTSTAVPLSVTLVWTDAPAAPFVYTSLVNDLDLVMVDPNGQRYYGNFGTTARNDRLNNVEHIEIPAPIVGTYFVQVVGFNLAETPQPYSLVATAAEPATFQISGRIVDTRGFAVRGAGVTVEGVNAVPGRRVTTMTRADGTYLVTNLLPGRYRVTPSKEYSSFTPTERRVNITTSSLSGLDFTAQRLVNEQISGHVADYQGRPVAGEVIDIYDSEGTVYHVTTGADGSYFLSELIPGEFQIIPRPMLDHFITPGERFVSLPSTESDKQDFFVSHVWYSQIDVYTLFPSRDPIPSAMVTVERREGDAYQVVQQLQTNSQGFVRLGGQDATGAQILREGKYRISVTKRGYTFEVTIFRGNHVEGPLPPEGPYIGLLTGTLGAFYFWGDRPAPTYAGTGLVRAQWDRPVPDVNVRLDGLNKGNVFTARTRSDGFYYIAGLPGDIYKVTLEKPGWQFTAIDPMTGLANPTWEASLKAGPPAHVPPVSVVALLSDPWFLGFEERDLAYQYPNGRQDFWAMPVTP